MRSMKSSRPDKGKAGNSRFFQFMPFMTYILFSQTTGRYYAGITNDLIKRFNEHEHGRCSSTKKGSPWIIVFQEAFTTRDAAHFLELKIKKRGAKRFLCDRGVVPPLAG